MDWYDHVSDAISVSTPKTGIQMADCLDSNTMIAIIKKYASNFKSIVSYHPLNFRIGEVDLKPNEKPFQNLIFEIKKNLDQAPEKEGYLVVFTIDLKLEEKDFRQGHTVALLCRFHKFKWRYFYFDSNYPFPENFDPHRKNILESRIDFITQSHFLSAYLRINLHNEFSFRVLSDESLNVTVKRKGEQFGSCNWTTMIIILRFMFFSDQDHPEELSITHTDGKDFKKKHINGILERLQGLYFLFEGLELQKAKLRPRVKKI
jgi:hypothetical protein